MSPMSINSPISDLNGVGRVRASQLNKLGIYTVRDLIYYFPRAFEKRGSIRSLSAFDSEQNCSYRLTVSTRVSNATIRKGLTVSKFKAFDESGACEITFFNCPFVKDVFKVGSTYRFWGKVNASYSRLQMTNPKYEPYIEGMALPDLTPIYSLTEGISSKQIDKLIKSTINDVLPQIIDPIPDKIRVENSLPTLVYSLKNAHFPESEEALINSRRRLAFDEMLYFGLGLSLSSVKDNEYKGIKLSKCSLTPLTELLPYQLTESQKRAINDIYSDMVIGENGLISPMKRIIVGDVGCGKTICATIAAYISARSKYQTALMVPTEILARQHYEEMSSLLGKLDIKVELLLGSTTQKEKQRIRQMLSTGEIDVIVGTHALISDGVEFKNLALVITDEQHRFGVAQRARLKEKDSRSHMLVMSATPIPRTLALTMYGDLEISKITDMPKGRQRVDTFVVNEEYRKRLNDFIKKQVYLGGQCYVVCPTIENSDDENEGFVIDYVTGEIISEGSLNLKSVFQCADDLKKALPDLNVQVLHGRMKGTEKEKIMSDFVSGKCQVLVSTTVIEVGVNVPNACLMIIENAERFGLSQLHQLRGRVGRGERKSYCILVSDINSPKSRERLDIMRTTYDGFEIAEKDLLLRGPGDFFASVSDNNLRQSGGFQFEFASLDEDGELLSKAFSAAKTIVLEDSELALSENKLLRSELERRISLSSSTIS